ncbi:lipopolysaccharide transport periplasmic protein LptA [Glaciecola petra]|uniref:Lipopolysaccharide transport periplasmic protein LptA n=1 Tax=Glaciecola petra TaxID=3075602 RepID=A0ABU2ZTM0_9ALTE|nr:lipopolysaccharide transport periplasmic protein LptA [Aestuariibacter sp. P117]MDT0595993.1 lipopolysaccharide transport periplasmic protein LptA [Aestuariibacter sp. P117]
MQNQQSTAQDESATASKVDAISTDFNLPVTLVSNSQTLDGKKKTSIFIDNVVIRQGSLEILAQRVEADAAAGKGKEIIMASGNPASYKQRLEDGTMVEARANEIVYEVGARTISLKGVASIVQNEIQVTGDSIVFDMAKEQILASSTADSSGPVTTVLSPGAFSNSTPSDKSKENENEEDE